jgi:type IV secretory pathway VirB4 component
MATTAAPTQDFVPVKEVRDGVIVLKDESLCKVVLVSSINLSLKSYEEQKAILMQFQGFLNGLDFPIQILIQSRRYDIRPYLLLLEGRLKEQEEPLLQTQTREYIEFIRSFNENVNIMRKSFYVVVPYIPPLTSGNKGIMGKITGLFGGKDTAVQLLKDFEEQRTQLEQRASVVEQGLGRLGVRTAGLDTEALIELLYKTFNPGEGSSNAKMPQQ